jgi:hypothetical protein
MPEMDRFRFRFRFKHPAPDRPRKPQRLLRAIGQQNMAPLYADALVPKQPKPKAGGDLEVRRHPFAGDAGRQVISAEEAVRRVLPACPAPPASPRRCMRACS